MVEQRERWFFLLALGVIALYVSPLFLLGENTHIRVHDNLDSNIAWYKVLSESGKITGPLDANIPQIANGQLSRNALGSELTGIVWLHAFCGSSEKRGVSSMDRETFLIFNEDANVYSHLFDLMV
ncbi:hypothetical protein GLN3_02080 [Geobacillus lituanicus]|nr:hypothetical protein GLN3_02080 [Geobacillus lituanicus]